MTNSNCNTTITRYQDIADRIFIMHNISQIPCKTALIHEAQWAELCGGTSSTAEKIHIKLQRCYTRITLPAQ
jgi:hypothetical protein